MWNNIQTNSNMGLQMLSTSSKRPREDYLNGDADDDGPAPAKMCKPDESLWSSSGDYYASGKCYQCSDSNASFYGGSPFACDHYSGPTPASPTHQCWPTAGATSSQQQQPPSQHPQPLSTSPPHSSLSQPSPQQQQSLHQPSAHHLPPHLHPSHLPHHQAAVSLSQTAASPHLGSHLCSNSGGNANSSATNHLAAPYHHPIHHESPPTSPQQHQQHHHHHHHHHHHLQQQQQQQTIRCDENGKSYLDLGSGSSSCLVSSASTSYCAGRSPSPSSMSSCALAAGPAAPNAAGGTTIPALNPRSACHSKSARCGCGIDDYERRRINVLNLSMFKLGKYRAFPDPSLYRSVLICNTLRHIEREMEQEGCFGGGGGGGGGANGNNQQSAATTTTAAPPFFMLEPPPEPPRAPTPYPQTSGNAGNVSPCGGGSAASGGLCPATSLGSSASSSSGSSCGGSSSADEEDGDSGIGDDNRSINWGSVLSLSSQSDLDPLNNNDSLGELDFSQELDELIPASCKLEDILKQVPSGQQSPVKESPDIENIMQVLRFTTS